jgi:hypothetical protein
LTLKKRHGFQVTVQLAEQQLLFSDRQRIRLSRLALRRTGINGASANQGLPAWSRQTRAAKLRMRRTTANSRLTVSWLKPLSSPVRTIGTSAS